MLSRSVEPDILTRSPCKKPESKFFPIAWLFCTFLAGLVCSPILCSAQTVLNLDGHPTDVLKSNSGKVLVLVFVRHDCPISNRYAPEIQRISAEHAKDASFFLIFPDKSESAAGIQKYLADYHYSISALRDPAHALVKQSHAQVTPEAAVFDSHGSLIYHGRIDNLYASIGHARQAATSHDLEEAIADALAHRMPAQKETTAVGCFISDLQ